MFTYFTVPTTTTNLVVAVNTVYTDWASGKFVELATIILSTLFGIIILGYVLKIFTKH